MTGNARTAIHWSRIATILAIVLLYVGSSSITVFSQTEQAAQPATSESTTAAPTPAAAVPDSAQPEGNVSVDVKDLDLELALPKPEVIIYSPNNRRDPFISLIEGIKEEGEQSDKKEFMNISDLTLKGVLQIPNGYLAIFQGVNGKTYLLKEGDSVYDGKLIKIESNKVVFEKPEYTLTGTVKKKEIIDIPLHM